MWLMCSFEGVEAFCFADDLKIYASNPNLLQLALTALNSWCQAWQLRVSPDKCHILRIGNSPQFEFKLGDQIIPEATEVRDLGIIVDSSLTFSQHCIGLEKSGRRSAFQTLRCFQSGRVSPLVHAYKTYVRPKLEYATQVYYPQTRKDSKAVENVQRFFTRVTLKKCGLRKRPYEERLRFFSLDSLELRRAKLDLLLAYKMFHGFTPDCDVLTRYVTTRVHRNNCKLIKEPRGCSQRLLFFPNRVATMWNSLPESVLLSDLNSFKTFIGL